MEYKVKDSTAAAMGSLAFAEHPPLKSDKCHREFITKYRCAETENFL